MDRKCLEEGRFPLWGFDESQSTQAVDVISIEGLLEPFVTSQAANFLFELNCIISVQFADHLDTNTGEVNFGLNFQPLASQKHVRCPRLQRCCWPSFLLGSVFSAEPRRRTEMWKVYRCHGVRCSYHNADCLVTVQMLVVKAAQTRSYSMTGSTGLRWCRESPGWYWEDDHPWNSLRRRIRTWVLHDGSGVFHIHINSLDDLLHCLVSSEPTLSQQWRRQTNKGQ